MRNELIRRVPLNVLVSAGPAFLNFRNVMQQIPLSSFAFILAGGFDRYGQRKARNQRPEIGGQRPAAFIVNFGAPRKTAVFAWNKC
jgi:hypothetical protein